MVGNVSQLVALVSYGNYFLRKGALQKSWIRTNTTFKYCNSVEFGTAKRFWLLELLGDTSLEANVLRWFRSLRSSGCTSLRLYYEHTQKKQIAPDYKLAGLVGGGGYWLIEVVYKETSTFWAPEWHVSDPTRADRKIWQVRYHVFLENHATKNLQFDLADVKSRLAHSLTEIADFALSQKLHNWSDTFLKARAVLHSPRPSDGIFEAEMLAPDSHSLTAQQLVCCASEAWVFGAMGSWNDETFADDDVAQRYEDLSATLYDLLIDSILGALNVETPM